MVGQTRGEEESEEGERSHGEPLALDGTQNDDGLSRSVGDDENGDERSARRRGLRGRGVSGGRSSEVSPRRAARLMRCRRGHFDAPESHVAYMSWKLYGRILVKNLSEVFRVSETLRSCPNRYTTHYIIQTLYSPSRSSSASVTILAHTFSRSYSSSTRASVA